MLMRRPGYRTTPWCGGFPTGRYYPPIGLCPEDKAPDCNMILNKKIGLLSPAELGDRYEGQKPCPPGNAVEKRNSCKSTVVYQKPETPFDDVTTYRNAFKAKHMSKREPIIPPYVLVASAEQLVDATEYNCQYVPRKVSVPASPPWAKQEEFVQSTEPFCALTTYRQAFFGETPPRRKTMKPIVYLDESKPWIDMNTCYREEFKPYGRDEFAKKVNPHDVPLVLGDGYVDPTGLSTYKSDFFGQSQPKIGLFKRETFDYNAGIKMENCSTYRKAYTPYYFIEEKNPPKCVDPQVFH